MSPINFDTLQAEYPGYADAWAVLQTWFASNVKKRFVETGVLAKALWPGVEPATLVLVMAVMADSGMVESAFRVRAPSGDLLEGEFEAPDEIPKRLWSRDHSHKVRTSEGDIVSGYRWVTADAA